MNWHKPFVAIGLVIGLAGPLLFPAPALSQNTGEEARVQGSKNIRSLQEIRSEGVVRQKWDMSCGAAALSTVLTYDFKDPTPETAIVVWLLHRLDAAKVRAIFVHPEFARKGLGTLILARVEAEARVAGFRRFEMGSTLTGVPLYRLRGYVEVERIVVPLANGEEVPVVKMVKEAG